MAELESSKRPNRIKDITGQTFGKLTVLEFAGIHPTLKKTMWRCQCSCPNKTIITAIGNNLRRGISKSCICGKSEATRIRNTKHSMHGTPVYRTWRNIRERCFNPKNSHYGYYGGRGITMDPAWRFDFKAFYDHVGPKPEGNYSIDRIDNEKGYFPGNVRWASDEEQRSNKRKRISFPPRDIAGKFTK